MVSSYLAHISTQGQTQSVFEHLHGTASLSKIFVHPFDARAQAELAWLANDVGKYSEAFQIHLQGESIQNTDPMRYQ